MRRYLVAAICAVGLVGAPPAAQAACSTLLSYVHAKHWVWRKKTHRVHGKRVVEYKVVHHHRRPVYVRVRVSYRKTIKSTSCTLPATARARSIRLRAHVDPTFTRDPADPFRVVYAYNAAADVVSFAADSLEEPAEQPVETADPELPEGVLNLYSDGKLACSMEVGGTQVGGECPVAYEGLGAHTVITTYTSGESSATETEVEQIEPFSTTTTVSPVYEPQTPVNVHYLEPRCVEESSEPVTHCLRYTEESHVWLLGHLQINAAVLDEHGLPVTGSVNWTGDFGDGGNVYGYSPEEGPSAHELTGILVGAVEDPAKAVFTLTPAEMEQGAVTTQVSFAAQGGYSNSVSTVTPVVFQPRLEGGS